MTSTGQFPDLAPVPDGCTLPTADRPLRQAEFDDLFTSALRDYERPAPTHARLTLVGPPDLAATVTDLTAREAGCCSLFTFTVTATAAGRVTLDIEVPESHVAVLDGLTSPGAPGRSTR